MFNSIFYNGYYYYVLQYYLIKIRNFTSSTITICSDGENT